MAKITIKEIEQVLFTDGWRLISTEYKNLNEILHFKCNEGHDVYAPYKKIRASRECPVCKDNYYKNQDTAIVPKKDGVIRVLGLDQSTNVSAWSIIDDGKLVKYGVFIAKGKERDERINKTKIWFINLISLWQPNFIGFEDIQLQNFGKGQTRDYTNSVGLTTYKALAELLGVLIDIAWENNIPYELCPPASWRNYCQVKGRGRAQQKANMQARVKEWYDVSVTDDEADAIGIGRYAASKRLEKGPEVKMHIFK